MIYNRFSHFQSPEVKRCFRYGVFSFLLAFAVTASAATPEKTNARKQIYVATRLMQPK